MLLYCKKKIDSYHGGDYAVGANKLNFWRESELQLEKKPF